MATSTNITALLKFFAKSQKNAVVDFGEFRTFLRKYTEQHPELADGLSEFLQDSPKPLQEELEKLVSAKQVALTETTTGRIIISVVPYFSEIFAAKYKEIETNTQVPFPTLADLPKVTPKSIVQVAPAEEILTKLLGAQESDDTTLYGLLLPSDEPAIILPSRVSVVRLVESSLAKIQNMLKKDNGYILKKLTSTNPGKEMTAKNFYNGFVDRPDHGIEILRDMMEDFYLWHQLCYFVKQDAQKKRDYTLEDMSTLQAILITEIASNYFKGQAMSDAKKDGAFKTLETFLGKPPYYFSYDSIAKFVDPQGHSLIGQYTEQELKDWLHEKTTGGDTKSLPEILVFKAEDEKRYFIYKSKVLQLVIRLCSDARDSVRDSVTSHWNRVLMNYGTLPEMKDQNAFEDRLKSEVKEQFPILHALLSSSFLPLLTYEKFGDEDGGTVTLFSGGDLLPYSELLLMNRADLLSAARMRLPFWYTTPVISWIAKMLFGPSKRVRNRKPKNKVQKAKDRDAAMIVEDAEASSVISKNSNLNRKIQLKAAARDAEKELVSEASTIDIELDSYERIWNKKIGKSRDDLHEDVNVLIRDYVRSVLRTMSPSGFTMERIKSLSSALVKTPAMMKIGELDALERYVQLYIIKLVKNLPTHSAIEAQFK